MSDVAIKVEGLSKKYHIGRKQEKYKTLRDTLAGAFVAPFRKAGKLLRGQATGAAELDETIWALKDVSFEIKEGEVVGIIGRNGAGKSTLLKILSRITEPTKGFAEIHGRVGSLLEVGTGFHPELTGRENIYLSGAILGMKRVEIDKKFDEIVAFAEVDKFIDTPVKHYSSGMYLRLAFAVAAHLEPEILFVDEVLAVGDARFQKKCINKMQDIGHEGRTILFVSHNMATITRLCSRAILLEEGNLLYDGLPANIVARYINSGNGIPASRIWNNPEKAPGGNVARLKAVRALTMDNKPNDVFEISQPIKVEMEYEVIEPSHVLLPHFAFFNEDGVAIFITIEQDPYWRSRPRPAGQYISSAIIPGNFLSEGKLFVEVNVITTEPVTCQFSVRDAIAFQIMDGGHRDSARGDWIGHLPGLIRPLLEWKTQYFPN